MQQSNPDTGDHAPLSGNTPSATNTANTFVVLHADLNTPSQDMLTVNSDLRNVSRDVEVNSADVITVNDSLNSVSGRAEVKIQDVNRDVGQRVNDSSMETSVEKDLSILNTEREHKAVNCVNKEAKDMNTSGLVMNKDVNLRNKLVLVQSKYLSFQPNSQLIDCSFVHVFVVATETERQDLHMGLSSVMMKLSKECQKDVLVYGVLTSVSTHVQSFDSSPYPPP